MCGIVGLISKRQNGFFHKDLENFRALLVNDTQRGEDSTGAFCAHANGNAKVIKVATTPFNLFMTDEWAKFQNTAVSSGRILIGHNRKATQGGINSANAHPFVEGDLVMVHNGTLRGNHKTQWGDREVDSHALCLAMSERGHEAVIPEINGAFALAWYNTKTERLYMIRNHERPLSMVITEDIIGIASEAWMAFGQFMRNDVKIEETINLEVGTLYEVTLQGKITTTKMELRKLPELPASQGNSFLGRNWESPSQRSQSALNWPDDDDEFASTTLLLPQHPTRAEIMKDLFDDPSETYQVGQIVQVKVHRIVEGSKRGQVQTYKCHCSVMDYNKQTVDLTCDLPVGEKPNSFKEWIARPCTAEVLSFHHSTCGPSIQAINLQIDDIVQTFNEIVPSLSWKRILEDEAICHKCSAIVHDADHMFTSIKFQKDLVRVHCHKCVVENLSGDQKDAFIKRRAAAVQARESISKESGKPAQSIILAPSSSTTH